MQDYKIFTINPGSTSTKIALFYGGNKIYYANVSHEAKVLERYETIAEQMEYRQKTIEELLERDKIDLNGMDICVGRGGGLLPMEGGTYEIDQLVLDHSMYAANGVVHPACLGPGLAKRFADKYNARAFTVNPPDVDELQDVARMTGIKGIYREVHLHALNLKETAIRHAKKLGKNYIDCNLIVCHIGGGISISAHKNGRMIDGFDIAGGEGPMTPTRCGSVSVANVIEYCKNHSIKDLKELCTKNGGFVDHIGSSNALEVTRRAENGDKYAQMLWDTMIYQIEKCIGAMAAVLHGRIDGIILGGGMTNNRELVGQIKNACQWIAPIAVYPGEFEMEAMAAGAIRVLEGQELLKKYSGICVFQGFSFE